jgi:beta-lactamase superfamily II metal-dependent hydrolase
MPRLIPPANGITVRMYRQGHGDCFLLAMPRAGDAGNTNPVYLLIDCGYKPGSPGIIPGNADRSIATIIEHLEESTGKHLDLAVMTHEHQDHLNGIWKKNDPYFRNFQIDEAWLAWTEDPGDDLANQLRDDHDDQLLELVKARKRLALAVGEQNGTVERLDSLLGLELGSHDVRMTEADLFAAAEDPAKSINKQGLKLIIDKATAHRGVQYLKPGDGPITVPGTNGIRAYVLGPPRSKALLGDEDPHEGEGFPREFAQPFTFRAAIQSETGTGQPPFSPRFTTSLAQALAGDGSFARLHYGKDGEGVYDVDNKEALDNADWRRIDAEWLYSAEDLALKLNKGINNTSLVLAIELLASRKVLLFAADAQRGNWISWANVHWGEGTSRITSRDLLSRTVLYKVGHHGSHNATLLGTAASEHPNLEWLATTDSAAGEFAAMITAVNAWALNQTPPWVHPLPSIKTALLEKARGRVFQTDEDHPTKPNTVSDAAWSAFTNRCTFKDLYFDYTVLDE